MSVGIIVAGEAIQPNGGAVGVEAQEPVSEGLPLLDRLSEVRDNLWSFDGLLSRATFHFSGEDRLQVELAHQLYENIVLRIKVVNFFITSPHEMFLAVQTYTEGGKDIKEVMPLVWGPHSGRISEDDFAALRITGPSIETVEDFGRIVVVCSCREAWEEVWGFSMDAYLKSIYSIHTCPFIYVSTPVISQRDGQLRATVYIMNRIIVPYEVESKFNGSNRTYKQEVINLGWFREDAFWRLFESYNLAELGGDPFKPYVMARLMAYLRYWSQQPIPSKLPKFEKGR